MKTFLLSLLVYAMPVEMPKLPYANNALEPVISEHTVNFHYGKHLQAYVNNLNKLVEGTTFDKQSLEEIVSTAPDGAIFNNAGQVLNHTLYFQQFTPKQTLKEPTGKLRKAIERDFGSFDKFKQAFNEASIGLFGSGWVWLAADKEGKLHITQEANGSNPLRRGWTPLLGFDVWEHAYYLDFQNKRADHIQALWSIINWETVAKRME